MNKIKGRTFIINHLIKKNNYENYLEIGCAYKYNFDMVLCNNKTGVDPAYPCEYNMTSNEFFSINNKKYDIIFIDGLHHYEQVLQDFINSYDCLSINGTILLHDCLPTKKDHQMRHVVDPVGWTGDIWKAVFLLKKHGYNIRTIDYDWGIGYYKKVLEKKNTFDMNIICDKSYEDFENNKQKYMDIITKEEFYKL